MQASTGMKRVIGELALRHRIHLGNAGAYMRLEMPGFDRLSIENVGGGRISVAHYFEQNGDLIADPEIVFALVGDWYPVEIQQVLGGWRQFLAKDAQGRLICCNPRGQADVTTFADLWARNIEAQGWIDHGQLTRMERGE